MICSQVTVGDGTTKNYDCVNGTCVESTGGQYSENTCAGACKKKDDTSMYIIGGAIVLGLAWLLGSKK